MAECAQRLAVLGRTLKAEGPALLHYKTLYQRFVQEQFEIYFEVIRKYIKPLKHDYHKRSTKA